VALPWSIQVWMVLTTRGTRAVMKALTASGGGVPDLDDFPVGAGAGAHRELLSRDGRAGARTDVAADSSHHDPLDTLGLPRVSRGSRVSKIQGYQESQETLDDPTGTHQVSDKACGHQVRRSGQRSALA